MEQWRISANVTWRKARADCQCARNGSGVNSQVRAATEADLPIRGLELQQRCPGVGGEESLLPHAVLRVVQAVIAHATLSLRQPCQQPDHRERRLRPAQPSSKAGARLPRGDYANSPHTESPGGGTAERTPRKGRRGPWDDESRHAGLREAHPKEPPREESQLFL